MGVLHGQVTVCAGFGGVEILDSPATVMVLMRSNSMGVGMPSWLGRLFKDAQVMCDLGDRAPSLTRFKTLRQNSGG